MPPPAPHPNPVTSPTTTFPLFRAASPLPFPGVPHTHAPTATRPGLIHGLFCCLSRQYVSRNDCRPAGAGWSGRRGQDPPTAAKRRLALGQGDRRCGCGAQASVEVPTGCGGQAGVLIGDPQ
jgi:hypothetical protein